MCAASRVPVRQEPGPRRGRAPSKGHADLRVEARKWTRCEICGQFFFVADEEGVAVGDFEADFDGDGEAALEGVLLSAPVPEPVPDPLPLAVVTAATTSFTAFSAAFVNVSALGDFSPARPAPL